MKAELEALQVTDNKELHRFELLADGYTSFIIYRDQGAVLQLIHTETDPALEGRGVGSALVEKTLQHIEAAGKKIIPLCPFVAAYIKRHPDWKRIVAE